MAYAIVIFLLVLSILMCWQESKHRKISFIAALLICIVTTPFVGYFIINSRPLRVPRGCQWCGNAENEAEFCGLCGKNAAGELRPGYHPQ
jgi:hypothetical protein